MKISIVKVIACLIVASPICSFAAEFKCVQDGKNPNSEFANEYKISVDSKGALLTVDEIPAKSLGNEKYKAGRKTFWYFSDNQRLSRFDLALGYTDFDCK